MSKIPNRASPLPPEARKAAIIEAVIPAMIEHGAALTSRQIAEAAGVAEGTVFRAFGDKETLLREAAETYLDPAPLRARLAAVESSLPLEEKVCAVLTLLQQRFHGVISIMAATGRIGDAPPDVRQRTPERPWEYVSIVSALMKPELERLNVPLEDIAPYVRLIAFATSIPAFNQERVFDPRELSRLIVYGVAGGGEPEDEDAARAQAGHAASRGMASTEQRDEASTLQAVDA
ncbi:TetR/AcrR family transcriptional regulator [Humibacter ginsenosidimutans]|uniref:TetR/AcrR family transcriptional regulator n=1 Tax=Humibacter ginsenosidimutans TaxID=2599293 RepID=A0A5B8M7U5_9MICO|nr:TetR/AcrR family transcriptional regulator [Humibacter ginsenosidimutans]QDZ16557.1 TetR/AcrR family transcriptional regulator [Humibacter ginsenosidimutans]